MKQIKVIWITEWNLIKKYYGEVLGPIWTIQNNAFGDTPNKTKAKIFHPTAENEPLTDYEVRYPRQNKPGLKNRQLQTNKSKNTTAKRLVDSMLANNRISAKSGTTTNTVKSQDIISLVVQRKDIHKFWKDSKQWGVLEILADNKKVTINGANVVAVDVMASNGVIHVIDSVILPPEK